jgi:hypothetical protein
MNMKLNLMDEPNKDCLLRVFELGTNQFLHDTQREDALAVLEQLGAGATILDFINALDERKALPSFCAEVRRSFLLNDHESLSTTDPVCDTLKNSKARQYTIDGISDAQASLIWPIESNAGQVALIKVDLAYRADFCDKTSNATSSAIEILKKHFVPMVNSALILESVAGERNNFAHVQVLGQSEAHQEFELAWNFVSHDDIFTHLGLPADLLEQTFGEGQIPRKLPLSKLQRDREDSLQKQEDSESLLHCLETLQGLMTRLPGKIKLQVSEETAIALLASHGSQAAEALVGLERFAD